MVNFSGTSTILAKVTILLGGFGFIWIICICVYRLWFHPLAKYPGPFLARISNFYGAYHAWIGDLHIDMWRVHEIHGDIVRYGPNRVLINTASGLRDIYGHSKNVKKSKLYNSMVHRAPNILTQRDKKAHARNRRILSYGFSETALRNYLDLINPHLSQFVEYLVQSPEDPAGGVTDSGGWSPPRNMAHWCHRLGFDLMFAIIFGLDYEMVRKPDHRGLIQAIIKSSFRVGVLIQIPWLKANRRLNRWVFPTAIAARTEYLKFVSKLLQSKASKDTEKSDGSKQNVFSLLTSARDPEIGEALTPSEIQAETTTIMVAGSDTTGTALTAFLFYISRYPEAYNKVVKEIRNHFASAEEILIRPKVNQCNYLQACIIEAMRLSPSVGSALYREVEIGGAVIDGEMFPAGVDVATAIYAIHHNPAYYPDPFTFIPERWIVEEGGRTKESVDLAHSAYTVFSIGPRACMGRSLAMMEMMSVLATLLYSLDIKIADGSLGHLGEGHPSASFGRHRAQELQLKDYVTATTNGPMLQFRPRKLEG